MTKSAAYKMTRHSGCLLGSEVEVLQDLVRKLPPNPLIINIGAGDRGISTLAMLEERKDAVIFSVDPDPTPGEFETLRKEGMPWRRVIRVLGKSQEAGENWPFFVDLVFVDGDHHYEAVCGDIRAWLPKIKFGGMIAFHDHAPPKPRKQTPTQLQKEAWVKRAADELMMGHEVVVHADRLKVFRQKGNDDG